MPTNPKLLRRITARPDVFGGKPIIRDLRIAVEHAARGSQGGPYPAPALTGVGAG
ncbi:MAG: DUF433 domain-containing protein [Chloroflexota bacterium]|nr:DUF433 domain-containing protein [Chloroflexota bacterium]